MYIVKEEDRTDSGEQQDNRRIGAHDQTLHIGILEQFNRDIAPLLLLFGSFLLVFNTWYVKRSLYTITVESDLSLNYHRGLLNSFGAYQAYYSTDFLSHKSSSAISWIGTIQAFLLDIVGVAVGPIFDRGYLHTLVYTGSILIVFGMLMLSLCTTYWQVLLTQGVCVGIGMGFVFIPSVAVVTATFEKKRAIAVGIAASASSVGESTKPTIHLYCLVFLYHSLIEATPDPGGVIYPIIFRELQPRIGFGWATRAIAFLALGTFIISFPALSSYKLTSKPPRSLIEHRAFRELPFVLYLLALFVLCAGYFVPLFYITTYASTHLHTSSDTAFYLLAVTNAAAFFGRLLPGLCPTPFAKPDALPLATAAAGISVLAWMAVKDLAGFIVFCVAFGALSGVIITLLTIMVPVLAPATLDGKVGARLGMAYAACGFGILIGSPVAGAVSRTSGGGFRGAQIWGGGTLLLGAVLLVYPWWTVKKREN
ncbi:MAG: hypothetical protein HETSPECPRED_004578 [Heterodermia speciosa]|uniref:Major facilitator superfamily (MFS) profile domain-containing protein n=1 Tax=Heterodermia speciosa TaxID=116794 RepID=A0A8H3FDC0_9LECA|nr:MAG: hypothetical protein HETSPECPRED_004578 [Heterodermia speciosa]